MCAAALFVLAFYYVKFSRRIDRHLARGPFADTMNLFSTPRTIAVGDPLTADQIVARLRATGYSSSRLNPRGWYNLRSGAIEIFPGSNSYVRHEPGLIQFARGKVARIVSLADHTERKQMLLEPELITNLAEGSRDRRRLVSFPEIPPALVHAVVSVEDKRFFRHNGLDMLRILKAAYVDLKEGRKEQGASTLSMQLARSLWLEAQKSWRRKAAEVLMAMHLEEKLSKEKIFEIYCNQVYVGRLGTYSIRGFGEAARAYFGKEIGQLTVPEAALLAGMVQRPSYYNPFRHPERTRERRDVVLALMRENGFLTEEQRVAAAAEPVRLSPRLHESYNIEFLADLIADEVQSRLGEHALRSDLVYTTLDWNLQRDAEAAVRDGMAQIDATLRKRRRKAPSQSGQPQVALLALDPRTGQVKALVGARDDGSSQLNHVLALRQPGSVFKPFVYAAALNTAVEGGSRIFTPASTIVDEPTSFQFGSVVYEPNNYHEVFHGTVTLRQALLQSLNVPTVKLAEMVGYDAVVNMARRAGLNHRIQATPAVALGAYEVTPLEIAGAYTVFANQGQYVPPVLVSMVRSSADGSVRYEYRPEPRRALDPRVAYLTLNLMEDVLRSGTGAGVRARGFTLPAAGKTGTSRDGWFAGFTSELLCVVWVGFDDNRELNLEGAKSALPIWADFMKRAQAYREYRDARPFPVPAGVVRAEICSETGRLASPFCPAQTEYFIDGSQPAVQCDTHIMVAPVIEPVPQPVPQSAPTSGNIFSSTP